MPVPRAREARRPRYKWNQPVRIAPFLSPCQTQLQRHSNICFQTALTLRGTGVIPSVANAVPSFVIVDNEQRAGNSLTRFDSR